MRRVKFKVFFPAVAQTPGRWEEMEGFFHKIGASYNEFESGPGNFSTAIVEDDTGKIHEVNPSDMQFLTPYAVEQNQIKA